MFVFLHTSENQYCQVYIQVFTSGCLQITVTNFLTKLVFLFAGLIF